MHEPARQVVCVTGASRGIGLATAARFLADGHTVFVSGRDPQAIGAAVAELAAAYPQGDAQALLLDVADERSIRDAFRTIFRTTQRLDVLVNNAGQMPSALLGTMNADALSETLHTNTTGALLCLQAAARLMQRHGCGAIVNVSSVLARVGVAGRTAYAASKGALESATRVAATELAAWGIRVNAVAPGWIDTELVADLAEPTREAIRLRVPLQRPGRADEVAEVIAWLAGARASYVTGAVIPVDGGYVP